MSKTETSGVTPTPERLTVTLPSDPLSTDTLAVVLHTPLGGSASVSHSTPVSYYEPAEPELPAVPPASGVQVTSADTP